MNPSLKRILTPVDMSDPSARALRYASAWALAEGARLDVLLVEEYELPPYLSPEIQAQVYTMMDSERRFAKERLEAFALPLIDPAARPRFFIERGFASDRILAAARRLGADALVMGTHGRSGLSRLLLGSVTESVIARTDLPVLTVRTVETEAGVGGRAPWKLELILVPVIGGPAPETPALAAARKLALSFETAPEVLAVQPGGDLAAETIDRARRLGADLIVVDGPDALGSAAARILRKSPCPVLLVPSAKAPARRARTPAVGRR